MRIPSTPGFLAATGARISELIQIKVEHIRIGCMDLYSKGGKLRRIYFPEKLCMEMLSWLEMQGKDSGFIFVNRRGQQITPRGISWQLKVLAKRYRIPVETIYPHSFRHYVEPGKIVSDEGNYRISANSF